jgi:hypothetical protein
VARPLTPAQREELSVEAYELSLRGHSARELARRFGVSHKTISSYLRAEAARRRDERPDYQQYALDNHRKAVQRCWEELDKNPTAHAVAQLLHALNAALGSIELIAGVRAPTRSKTELSLDVQLLDQGLPLLSDAELTALMMLFKKMSNEIDEDTDVLAEIVRKYEAGKLRDDSDEPLELAPVEEQGVDQEDFGYPLENGHE